MINQVLGPKAPVVRRGPHIPPILLMAILGGGGGSGDGRRRFAVVTLAPFPL